MTKRGFITCGCGWQVKVIVYKDGKKTCKNCNNANLSGKFLRRMELERQTYAKDILQPGMSGYEELYVKKS